MCWICSQNFAPSLSLSLSAYKPHAAEYQIPHAWLTWMSQSHGKIKTVLKWSPCIWQTKNIPAKKLRLILRSITESQNMSHGAATASQVRGSAVMALLIVENGRIQRWVSLLYQRFRKNRRGRPKFEIGNTSNYMVIKMRLTFSQHPPQITKEKVS
jgi:hypothetical protein